MEKIFSGKTLEAAKAAALAEFAKDGIDKYDVDFEIIEQPVKKLFGTKGEFRVKAIVTEKGADITSFDDIIGNTDIVLKQRAEVPMQDFSGYSEVPEFSESDPAQETSAPVSRTRFADNTFSGAGTSKSGAGSKRNSGRNSAGRPNYRNRDREYDTSPREPLGEFPKEAVLSYVEMMIKGVGGTDCEVQYVQDGGEVRINITGARVGGVIGRHGDVLESIQYLAGLMKNQCGGDGYKLSVDCNGYRSKRQQALEQLAERTAEKVLRYNKRVTLEPMSSYERRIIHNRVSGIQGVSSVSFGSEPYRKVVISVGERLSRPGGYRSDRDNGDLVRDNGDGMSQSP